VSCSCSSALGAKGAHDASDWDFGYLSGAGFDPPALAPDLSTVLRNDRLDRADLDRAAPRILKIPIASSTFLPILLQATAASSHAGTSLVAFT